MFKPIPKVEWEKMSDDEKNWANLEFQKDKAKARHTLLMFTRGVAILLILFVFYLWYGQLAHVQEISEYRRLYGNDFGCYLCGKENLRQCECTYNVDYWKANFDRENYSEYLGEYNIQECPIKELYGGEIEFNEALSSLNITK